MTILYMTILLMRVVYKMVYNIAGDHKFQNDVLGVISTFWKKYPIDVWMKNRNFHSLNGNICHLWTTNLPKLVAVFKKHKSTEDKSWYILCIVLQLWPKIIQFIKKVKVDENYEKEIKRFERNVIKFYKY